MGTKKQPAAPADKLALYEKLISVFPDVDRKGAANPYTSLNGHMYSFLTETGVLALRLEKNERESFLKKHKTQLCVRYNTVMKEYVEVPDSLLKRTNELAKYFQKSISYIASLKPKPTTRKKTATTKKSSSKTASKTKSSAAAKKVKKGASSAKKIKTTKKSTKKGTSKKVAAKKKKAQRKTVKKVVASPSSKTKVKKRVAKKKK